MHVTSRRDNSGRSSSTFEASKGIVILSLLALAGCSDPLSKLVNSHFPTVTAEEQRVSAINTTADALTRLTIASFGVGLDLRDASAALFSDTLRKDGITELHLDGDRQLVRVTASFDRTFSDADVSGNDSLAKILASLRPHIVGKVTAYAGVTGAVASAGALPGLDLRLLPAVSTVRIKRINVARGYNVTAAGDALTLLLTKYKDNISGELSRLSITHVTVPAMSDQPLDVNKTFQVTGGGTQATIVASVHPITIPFRVDSIAWLVSADHVDALAQIVPVDAPAVPSTAPPVLHTYEAITARFNSQLKESLAIPNTTGSWVAIRKDAIAVATNSALRQAGMCLTATADIPNQHSENKISLPNGLDIDCTPTKTCGGRECKFEANHDTRNCSACLVHNPFGGCAVQGNDPFCEAQKAAQNLAYNTDANLRKADCDRVAAQEKLTCETEKSATKLLCETKRAALSALARTGNFANLDIDASVKTSNMRVCLRDFDLDAALDHVKFNLDVQGSADARVNVKFVPLDIVGHLTCVMDWSKEQTFAASLRDSRIGIAADVRLLTDAIGASLETSINAIPVKAKVDPGPTEFLLRSPELILKCPVLAAVAPTAVALTPFVPQLKGDIDYTLPAQRLRTALQLPNQDVVGHKLAVSVTQTPVSLVVTGVLSQTL